MRNQIYLWYKLRRFTALSWVGRALYEGSYTVARIKTCAN